MKANAKAKKSTYQCWQSIKQRIFNPKCANYKDYGARGIKICKRWMHYENFLADMGYVPEGLSIDRIDNNGNYHPKNCRWATKSEQALNQRRCRVIEFNGKKQPLIQWSRELNLHPETIRARLRRGLTPAMAFSNRMFGGNQHGKQGAAMRSGGEK